MDRRPTRRMTRWGSRALRVQRRPCERAHRSDLESAVSRAQGLTPKAALLSAVKPGRRAARRASERDAWTPDLELF